MNVDVEACCVVLHDAYETAAVQAGWATQAASRKPWAEVPEANKATMRAAVGALLAYLTPVTNPHWPDCPNHVEAQHRDGRSPWCNACGWSRGRPAVPARHKDDMPSTVGNGYIGPLDTYVCPCECHDQVRR